MKKCVLVGASGRCLYMYAKPISQRYKKQVEITAVFDINHHRMNYISKEMAYDINTYDDFDQMMIKEKPDVAIITTVDAFHHEYIIRCLAYDCDVIVEKPLTIDEYKCKEILKACQKYNNDIRVTFNYRFTPYVTQIKKLLKNGAVGKILHVDFEYLLDRKHGADYFRRWHRYMKKSGGLLVHKSTHHFDLVNWWIDEKPLEVFANGALRFYGKNGQFRGKRCKDCLHAKCCDFYADYCHDDYYKDFYFNAEQEDGYYRDACVFDESIDIYDTMSATITYDKGSLLTYSLSAYNPYEGYKISIVGDKGRLEAEEFHSGPHKDDPYYIVTVYKNDGSILEVKVKKDSGSHGGGDAKLLDMLFIKDIEDPLHHMANLEDGIYSVMIGIAANKSITDKKSYKLSELL